jgi:quinol monooxygenase YgiN
MVTEFAEIKVKPGTGKKFIAGVQASTQVFVRAPGCHGMKLHRSIETPAHFVLTVEWDSVEAHKQFRASPDFAVWRANVGSCFAAAPKVWHSHTVAG